MSANTISTLSGFYKQVYGDSLLNLIPESAKFIKDVPFDKRKKLGDYYNVPVVLQQEQGFTYNNGDGSAFALNGALAMATKNAQVRGSEFVLQSQISYKAAAAATSSKEAFADATSTLFENMIESASNRLELSSFYGQSSLGNGSGLTGTYTRTTTTVTATTSRAHGLTTGNTVYFTALTGGATGGAVAITVTGATTFTFTDGASGSISTSNFSISPFVKTSATAGYYYVDPSEWSAGIWAGKVGAQLQFYTNNDSTLISSGADSVFTISAINTTYKRLSLTGTSTGVTAFIAVTASGYDTNGIYVYFYGAKSNDMLGINKIITTSGTLFNIDNSVYSLFKGNDVTISGSLTLSGILDAIEDAVSMGLMEDVTAYVPIYAFNILAANEAALRKYDSSYKEKGVNGFESLKFYGPNGIIEVVPHPIVKAGNIFIIPKKQFLRVGATDVSFKTPGMDSEEIFLQLPSNAGYEVRLYSDQALLCLAPAKCTRITGYTVS